MQAKVIEQSPPASIAIGTVVRLVAPALTTSRVLDSINPCAIAGEGSVTDRAVASPGAVLLVSDSQFISV